MKHFPLKLQYNFQYNLSNKIKFIIANIYKALLKHLNNSGLHEESSNKYYRILCMLYKQNQKKIRLAPHFTNRNMIQT